MDTEKGSALKRDCSVRFFYGKRTIERIKMINVVIICAK